MATGKVHRIYYEKGWVLIFLTSIPLSISMGIYDNSFLSGTMFFVFYIFHYFVGGYVNPDADFISITEPEYKLIADIKKKAGWIGGFIAILIICWWLIYGYVSGKHRAWYSHEWIVGTLGRMLHHNIPIFYFLFSLWGFDYNRFLINSYFIYWGLPYFTSQFIALVISDGIHLILDGIYPQDFFSRTWAEIRKLFSTLRRSNKKKGKRRR